MSVFDWRLLFPPGQSGALYDFLKTILPQFALPAFNEPDGGGTPPGAPQPPTGGIPQGAPGQGQEIVPPNWQQLIEQRQAFPVDAGDRIVLIGLKGETLGQIPKGRLPVSTTPGTFENIALQRQQLAQQQQQFLESFGQQKAAFDIRQQFDQAKQRWSEAIDARDYASAERWRAIAQDLNERSLGLQAELGRGGLGLQAAQLLCNLRRGPQDWVDYFYRSRGFLPPAGGEPVSLEQALPAFLAALGVQRGSANAPAGLPAFAGGGGGAAPGGGGPAAPAAPPSAPTGPTAPLGGRQSIVRDPSGAQYVIEAPPSMAFGPLVNVAQLPKFAQATPLPSGPVGEVISRFGAGPVPQYRGAVAQAFEIAEREKKLKRERGLA